jgi:hypothetical protein
VADVKQKFGTNGQTITISLGSLGNNSARESTYIDNGTNLFLDALVGVRVRSNSSGTSSTGSVLVYAYGTINGGSNYTEGATGSDAAITLTSPTNLRLVGVINVVANSTTYSAGPFSVATAFGGTLPERWGVVIENRSGAALDATGGNHVVLYQGVLAQTV